MRSLYKNFRLISDGKIITGDLVAENGRFTEARGECEEILDGKGREYLCPGFIDIHLHGGGGYSFMTSRGKDVVEACRYHLRHGVTSLLPTISSAPDKVIRDSLSAAERAAKNGQCGVNVIGAHIEGPYFSAEQCGAQNCAFIAAPKEKQYRDLYERFGKFIRRWDYAPELDKDYLFTRFLVERGIVASCGHSNATYGELYGAYIRGCRLITHLYSGTSTVKRVGGFRIPGVVEGGLLLDDMNVELIADGKHLPPELLRLVGKIKGESRVTLISDALPCAGEKDGKIVRIDGEERLIEDGVVKLPDRSAFAGSIASGDQLLRTAVGAGIPLPLAVKYLTENPASLFGLEKGRLASGFDADLVILDENLYVKNVIVAGKIVA